MKLLRYGERGQERPGMLGKDNEIRDLSEWIDDIDGAFLSSEKFIQLSSIDTSTLPIIATTTENIRLGPPVANVGKIPCIGLNYRDHAEETGHAIPTEPIVFMKATSAIVGPNDDVILPPGSVKCDWEVEVGIVIGREAMYVEEKNAMDYVAGFCVVNDVSERAYQLEGSGQWVKGKSANTFCPFGPYLTTKDEIPDPQNLKLWLNVNNARQQTGNTKTMIFGIAEIVSYLSGYMSLQPGDIIPTGTPPGVGMAGNPQRFLAAGDTMHAGVDGLGEIKQTVVAYQGN